MNVPVSPKHPVVFPVGNTGSDNINTALSLVKTAGICINSGNYTSAEEVVSCLRDVLDLAERYLEAGAAWARDAMKAEIAAEYAALEAAKWKRP